MTKRNEEAIFLRLPDGDEPLRFALQGETSIHRLEAGVPTPMNVTTIFPQHDEEFFSLVPNPGARLRQLTALPHAAIAASDRFRKPNGRFGSPRCPCHRCR